MDSLKEEDMEDVLGSLFEENDAESPTSENLRADGKEDENRFLDSRKEEDMENASVTLNAASADPDLTLSQDLKKVSLNLVSGGVGNKQSKPRPFYPYHCVWGSQGLSSGTQVWEAKLEGTEGRACMVGVATELGSELHTQDQLWALKISASGCQPVTSNSARQNIPIRLSKVGVSLDWDGGKIVFFDPNTNNHIYTFQASFTGEVFPFLGLLSPGTHITLSP